MASGDMRGDERFEQLIAFLGSQLARPVTEESADDGSIVFVSGDPAEVVVRLTVNTIVVSEFAGRWTTPHTLVAKPRRVGVVRWRRLTETATMNAVAALIRGAREVRLARYQICRHCGNRTAPEWLVDDHVCHACVQESTNVVH